MPGDYSYITVVVAVVVAVVAFDSNVDDDFNVVALRVPCTLVAAAVVVVVAATCTGGDSGFSFSFLQVTMIVVVVVLVMLILLLATDLLSLLLLLVPKHLSPTLPFFSPVLSVSQLPPFFGVYRCLLPRFFAARRFRSPAYS